MMKLVVVAVVLCLAGSWDSCQAQWRLSDVGDNEPTSAKVVDTCADGAVNGLITVSIAASAALFAEVAIPSYPILFTVGPAVGCPVRVIGKRLKEALLP